ncbi:MAG: biopolymer transport protein ExbB [Myxococcota bacterium]
MLEQGMMQFALLGAGWVLWLLVTLSVGCIAVSIERAAYLIRDRTDTAALSGALDAFIARGDLSAFTGALRGLSGHEARVLFAGAEYAPRGAEAAERAMASVSSAERLRMERGLAFLATVGSNAPFLGLFGTVLGIIQAFHDLSVNTSEASEAVMAGISEALVATAVGLLVAIPAVVLYNFFSRAVKGRLSRSASLAELMMASLAGTRAGANHGK